MARTRRVAAEVVRAIETPEDRVTPIPADARLSLGLTLLNLAVSGDPDWGTARGLYVWYVGESESGKTWAALQAMAEAAASERFARYQMIYDNAENGVLMDTARYFGAGLCKKLRPARGTVAKPQHSTTIEDFYYGLRDAQKSGKPFFYVLDSMDALTSKDDDAKFEQHYAADRNGSTKKVAGSFGMSKALKNSMNIKRVVNALPKTGSVLFVISQTRDNPDAVGFADAKRASGGKSLRFYAHVQIWTDVVGTIRKPYKGKVREIGKMVRFRIRKNRISGWSGEIRVPFLRNTGFDETGSMIDYLCDEKHWKRRGDKEEGAAANVNPEITAPEFNFTGKKEKLVELIESGEKRTARLRKTVAAVWRDIDRNAVAKRKPRYT